LKWSYTRENGVRSAFRLLLSTHTLRLKIVHRGNRCVSSAISERLPTEMFTPRRAERRCSVSRSRNNPDRDFSAKPPNGKIDAGPAENLFASPVIGYSKLVDDSQIRLRVGEIIARAMSRRTNPRARAGRFKTKAK
jgi:hypothetical protein